VKGFDAEFRDLDAYIRVITDRIWEGRRLDDIHRYYSADCAVETPSSVSVGVHAVLEGTRATLVSFPDRRLLAEDVIVSGDEIGGFLSSHRIASPMTHAGAGAFGAPSFKPVFARTIADCVCTDNRIVHEWLVRDQSAIARQTGQHERDVAQRWLNERGGFHKPVMPHAPAPYQSLIDTNPLASAYAASLQAQWAGVGPTELARTHASDVISAVPGGEVCVGLPHLQAYWGRWREAFPDATFRVEHLVANPRAGRATTVALRWRVQTKHAGGQRYGAPTGQAVEVLGIAHADIDHERVVREWVLVDDIAVWMQVLQPRR
jgi:predicted ester cyclase